MHNAFFMDLPVSSLVSNSSLLTTKGGNSMIVPLVQMASLRNGIVHIIHSGYFDCKDAFQTVLDS